MGVNRAAAVAGKEQHIQAKCKLDSDKGFFLEKAFLQAIGCDSYPNLVVCRRGTSCRYHLLLHRQKSRTPDPPGMHQPKGCAGKPQ